jgi:hypothetical protein
MVKQGLDDTSRRSRFTVAIITMGTIMMLIVEFSYIYMHRTDGRLTSSNMAASMARAH